MQYLMVSALYIIEDDSKPTSSPINESNINFKRNENN